VLLALEDRGHWWQARLPLQRLRTAAVF